MNKTTGKKKKKNAMPIVPDVVVLVEGYTARTHDRLCLLACRAGVCCSIHVHGCFSVFR